MEIAIVRVEQEFSVFGASLFFGLPCFSLSGNIKYEYRHMNYSL